MDKMLRSVSLSSKVKLTEKLMRREVDQVFKCPSGNVGYRCKSNLRVFEDNNEKVKKYAVNDPVTKFRVPLEDCTFEISHPRINQAMPIVLDHLNRVPILGKTVFEANFHTTLNGDTLVSLVHRNPLQGIDMTNEWDEAALDLRRVLSENTSCTDVSVIRRAKSSVRVSGSDFVIEKFTVQGQEYCYRQHEGSFSQPNAFVNQIMLEWALHSVRRGVQYRDGNEDLLEIYCGNGNFTVPLAQEFNSVLAGEIARTGVQDCKWALKANNIRNTKICRLSSAELSQAILDGAPFTRMEHVNLDDYYFGTIFVDPPRAGLDRGSLDILANHRGQIIYVSCNPDTLRRDIDALATLGNRPVEIHQLVCFDQFPGTEHIECGVVLYH